MREHFSLMALSVGLVRRSTVSSMRAGSVAGDTLRYICRRLLAVVGQVFELYPFLVVEEQNVQRLVHGSERHLLVIVRKDEAEVVRYDETAQPCLGRFDEQAAPVRARI